ncbi:MAG: hypothetical protein JSV78_09260 [Phycisphaerales bacterium]|nr:MAG: hypothetical protein JSV78_09260 [Phycisphaerales bacterium]
MTTINDSSQPHRLVNKFGLIVQDLRRASNKMFVTTVQQAGKRSLTKSNKFFLLALIRMTECLQSIELLISKNMKRDAAVLLLTLMELRLDMAHIADDKTRADEWFSHSKEGKKPWRVHDLINKLFPDESERKAWQANYRIFSMIKHGNPKSGTMGFPLGVEDGWLVVDRDPYDPNIPAVILFSAGSLCASMAKVAGSDFAASGFDVHEITASVEKLESKLADMNAKHVHAILVGYMDSTGGGDQSGAP